jgi:hypothetical protein
VTASIGRDGVRFEGREHLGACSYRNRQEFMQPGGYWEDMRTEARLGLQAQLLRAATHGTIVLEILNERFELALAPSRPAKSTT